MNKVISYLLCRFKNTWAKNDISEFSFTEKNKSEEEQDGTFAVYGETVTSAINEDIDDINVTYIHNDKEVQQKYNRKPIRIRSYSLKRQNNGKKVYSVVVNKRTVKHKNVLHYKFDYKDIDYDNVIKIEKYQFHQKKNTNFIRRKIPISSEGKYQFHQKKNTNFIRRKIPISSKEKYRFKQKKNTNFIKRKIPISSEEKYQFHQKKKTNLMRRKIPI